MSLGEHPNGLASPRDIKVAEELIEEIKEKLSSLEKKWTDVLSPQLQADDPDGLFDGLDSDVLDTSELANTWITGLKNAVEDYEATAAPAAAAAAAPAAPKKELKLNTAFKPSILARSSNLEEFHAWEDSFRGYYELNTAFLDAATPEMRRLFVTNLLDSKLQSALLTDKTVTMATPIVATGTEQSLLTWIKEYLLRHTPLFVRRYEYAMCHQQPNESFEDWWTRKLILARNCNLAEITEETYQITELICGINNQKMRDEMLKIKDPTLERLVTVGKSYDTSAHIQKATFGKEVNANKVQSGYKKEKFNASRNKAKDNNSQKNNPPSSS